MSAIMTQQLMIYCREADKKDPVLKKPRKDKELRAQQQTWKQGYVRATGQDHRHS